MAKMTMQQELEMLRKEIEELKRQKEEQEKREREATLAAKQEQELELAEAKEKAEEVIDSLKEGTLDAKETLNTLLETIKKDYENVSPVSAIVLFALGAAFGHALSSK